MVAFNHANYIKEAFHSIESENYPNIEFIALDNGSSDNSFEVIEQLKVNSKIPFKALRNPPGISVNQAYNQVVRESSGELIIFVPGDDISVQNRIDEQVQLFEQNPKLRVAYANGRFYIDGQLGDQVHEDTKTIQLFSKGKDEVLNYLYTCGFMIQTGMFKRELLINCGGFDEESIADDWILNIRIFKELNSSDEFTYYPKDTFLYRQHSSNTYKNFPRQSASMIEVIKKYVPEKIRKPELSKMYFYQSEVAFKVYSKKYWFLGLKYLFYSQLNEFNIKNLKEGLLMFLFVLMDLLIPENITGKEFIIPKFKEKIKNSIVYKFIKKVKNLYSK